jgi:hypothetical protein
MWRHHLVEYLAAKARHNEARRLFDRATRTFFTLADRKGVEEERAYTIAGLGLADKRMVSALSRTDRRLRPAFGIAPVREHDRAATRQRGRAVCRTAASGE